MRENGDEPPQLWRQAVARLTEGEIKTGLANLANDNLSFPANLSQFVSACKRAKPIMPWKALPAPPESAEQKDAKWEKQMRAMLGDERWEAMQGE